MKIAGLIKHSLIDYPGKITAVVFTQGCNFRCPYCHNPDLIPFSKNNTISEAAFWEFLKKRKGLLEAVALTGGEPTLQKDLKEFMQNIKNNGYLVKLDTNGTNPKVLREILEEGLADYIAMDIKHSIPKYPEVVGLVKIESIKESIKIIIDSGVEYEFRTTVLPKLHKLDDFKKIGEMIGGANKYFIQNFRPENTFDKKYLKEDSFDLSELEKIKKIMDEYVDFCSVRENI